MRSNVSLTLVFFTHFSLEKDDSKSAEPWYNCVQEDFEVTNVEVSASFYTQCPKNRNEKKRKKTKTKTKNNTKTGD